MRCKLLQCQVWFCWAQVITAVSCDENDFRCAAELEQICTQQYSTQTVVKRHFAPHQTWSRETYKVLENEF